MATMASTSEARASRMIRSVMGSREPDTPADVTSPAWPARTGTLSGGQVSGWWRSRDVYRVFEALDELVTIVEEARGLPMTSSCVVPRGDILELLDEVRDALPGD